MEKNIVVTGGSKGIGRAVVERFARAGFAVVTCARSEQDLVELKEAIEWKNPEAVLRTLAVDISNQEGAVQFANFVLQLPGQLAAVVNNAGAFVPGRLQDEPTDGSQLRTMLAVNLLSAYDVTRTLLPRLLAQGHGHVFTICSTASLAAYPNGSAYSIAKFALYGLTQNLREELKGQQIRVTAVLPGPTYTPSWEGAGLPPERFVKPEDVAEAIFSAYCLSPQAVVEELLIRPQLGDLF